MCFWKPKRISFEYTSTDDRFYISWKGHKIFSCPIQRFAFELEAINKYSFRVVGRNYGSTPVRFHYRVTKNGLLIDEYQEIVEGEWVHSSSKLYKKI